MQQSLNDMAIFMKNLIPSDISEEYTIKAIFKSVSDEKSIRNGVIAFRDFLYLLYDRLAIEGMSYEKPSKKDGHAVSLILTSPFLNNIKSVLINIGHHGELTEKGFLIRDWQLLTSSLSERGDGQYKNDIPAAKFIEVLRFLTGCGIYFEGIDINERKPDMSKVASIQASYPDNPHVLTGIKVMATAHKKIDDRKYDELFLRCDYRVLKNEETDVTLLLSDSIHPLPAKVKNFIMKLHHRYINAGLTCKVKFALGFRFAYFNKKKEIFMISATPNTGYRIHIKANNILQYPEIMDTFSQPLQDKIKKGYGCEKKMYGLTCQKGCHGYSFSLDDSVLEISHNIETWFDKELSCLQGK